MDYEQAANSTTSQDVIQSTRRRQAPIAPLWHTVLVLAVLLGGSAWGAFHHGLLGPETSKEIRYLVLIALEWILVGLIWWGIRKRGVSLSDLIGGRWARTWDIVRDLLIALAFLAGWFLVLLLLSLLLRPGHSEAVTRLLRHTRSELLLFLAVSATAGFAEEIMFRGYLQKQFEALFQSAWGALLLQGVVFGLSHGYQGEKRMAIISVFGCCFGELARRCKSLRPGMFAHGIYDAIGGLAGFAMKHGG